MRVGAAMKAYDQPASTDFGPKGHINIRISHSGSEAHFKGIPKTMLCWILVFMWPFGLLLRVCLRDLAEMENSIPDCKEPIRLFPESPIPLN